MAYVPVPKDLTKIKTKVMLNLTKRQLISFGSGALLGVPLFFLAKSHMSVSTAALLMVLSMLPFSCWPCMNEMVSPWKRSSISSFRTDSSDRRNGPTRPTTSMPP